MEVIFEKDDSRKEVKYSGTVRGLLKELCINPETVIIARGNDIIDLDEPVKDSESIMVISVVSGG